MLVAAWRSRSGASFALFEYLREEAFEIAVSVPLVLEYESVLIRHLRPPLDASDAAAFVDYLCLVAVRQRVFYLWRPLLKDPNDDMVVEVAVAAGCDAIITHNVRDFRAAERLVGAILKPSDFLTHLTA